MGLILIYTRFHSWKQLGAVLMRGGSIAEVLIVFLSSYIVGWLLLEDIVVAEVALLGWSYLQGVLLILVPLVILLLTGRSLQAYGITLEGWRQGLSVGMKCYLMRFVPLGTLLVMQLFGYIYTELTIDRVSGWGVYSASLRVGDHIYDVVPSEGVLLCSLVGAPIYYESGMKGVEMQPPGQRPVEEGGQKVM